jgi:hypothetical protein
MKILVEEQEIAPVRIFLEHSGAPKNGTPTVGVLQEICVRQRASSSAT